MHKNLVAVNLHSPKNKSKSGHCLIRQCIVGVKTHTNINKLRGLFDYVVHDF